METKIISFSGGRSSGMMLKIMQDNDLIDSNTHVIFANTGKEHEETLKFVDECSKRWDIQVVWLEYIDTAPFYKVVTFETAARNGEPFEALIRKRQYLPNPVTRYCTAILKIRTMACFLFQTGLFDVFEALWSVFISAN
jgi:3'-phosphoadenosine 5'-phosphosulfate sulfotransferase (PAPS reductase)/FAD synthetase